MAKSKVSIIVFVFLSSFLLAGTIIDTNNGVAVTPYEKIDDYVTNTLMPKNLMTPGTSLGIIHLNGTSYFKGFGIAGIARPMTPQTPMFLGSISKSFTALGILQLYENGSVELNSTIRDYLPWFTTKNPVFSDNITIDHLLHHVSGLYYEGNAENLEQTIEDLVRECRKVKPIAAPGVKYKYSNINYQILGLLIETISGKSYNDYIRENIFNPLNMTNSYLDEKIANQNELAQGHILYFGIPIKSNAPHPISWNPSSNIISTVEDMTHYLFALMNDGHFGSETILSKEGIQLLFSQSSAYQSAIDYDGYAMGWFNSTNGDDKIISHTGRAKNFVADAVMAPEAGWGVIIMHNVYSEFNQLYRCELGGDNIMNVLLGKAIIPKHSLSYRGFYILVDFIFVTIIISFGILPLVLTKRFFLRKIKSKENNKEKLVAGLIRCLPFIILGLFLLIVLPGILAKALGSVWVFFWMPQVLLVPDILTFLVIWSAFSLSIGIYRSIALRKELIKNHKQEIIE